MATKKEIERIIDAKIDDWLYTIPSGINCLYIPGITLREAIKRHYILTGGAIVSLLLGEKPNDWDIYFDNLFIANEVVRHYLNSHYKGCFHVTEEYDQSPPTNFKWHQKAVPGKLTITLNEDNDDTPMVVAKQSKSYYGEELESELEDDPYRGKFVPVLVSNNAITLNGGIQLVCKTVGNPGTIHQKFDFMHCVSYYTPHTGLVLNKFALESIMTKELKYLGSDYPIHGIFRVQKFLKRGWTISQNEMLKILWDISNLALDKETMKDQLFAGLENPWDKALKNYPDDGHRDRQAFHAFLDNEE